MSLTDKLSVRVAERTQEALAIRSFKLVSAAGGDLPPFDAGAHVNVVLQSGAVRQYSLIGDIDHRDSYLIAVQRESTGRGASIELYDTVKVGDLLDISHPLNHFELDLAAKNYVLIAGGIGVTPIFSMAKKLARLGLEYRLHYGARTPESAAFVAQLTKVPFADTVKIQYSDVAGGAMLDATGLLRIFSAGTHVYCCGPEGLMSAVRQATAHWPPGTVHFEHFSAPHSFKPSSNNVPFEVELAQSGRTFLVPPNKSILEVLEAHGLSISKGCEEGVCGTCLTRIVAGEADHRDFVLSDDEKAAQQTMTICCSRAKTARLKLAL
jgi:vanillate O-demethylase ferredoxin subunit